jgi:cytochrome c peroxidase
LKLSAQSFYGPLFTAAFGDAAISSDRIARALAQFVRSMVSYRSKYDSAFVNGVANFGATLTSQEEQGRQLFEGAARCDTCHGTVAHVADSAKNNGLDAIVTDVGAGGGRFKAPSLRNIAVRGPYMHDGRFATLEQVVDHYDSGVQDSANLAPGLRAGDGSPRRLNLSVTQKQALIAYLGTFTDTALTSDPKFADPFPVVR